MATTSPESRDTPLARLIPQPAEGADEVPIHSPVVHVGQGPHNDLTLDDDTVSTNHARLDYDAGAWRITDLESRNGTYIEGVRLAPGVTTPLSEGAMLAFGAVKFQFVTQEGADPERARAEYTEPEPATKLSERSAFRLPVWLLVALVVVVVALFALAITFGRGGSGGAEEAPEAPAATAPTLQHFQPAAA